MWHILPVQVKNSKFTHLADKSLTSQFNIPNSLKKTLNNLVFKAKLSALYFSDVWYNGIQTICFSFLFLDYKQNQRYILEAAFTQFSLRHKYLLNFFFCILCLHVPFTFIFSSLQSKIKDILEATFTHSKNLALFVMLYKSLTSLMESMQSKPEQYHSFLSAVIGGYLVFGSYNKVNEQVTCLACINNVDEQMQLYSEL